MPDSITITVPMPPNLANARMHHMTKHRKMKEYFRMLDERQRCGLIPPPPSTPLDRVRVLSVMVLGHRMDEDNAMARHKWVLDWLTTRGYWRNDTPDCVHWADFPLQFVKRKADHRIILTVTHTTE